MRGGIEQGGSPSEAALRFCGLLDVDGFFEPTLGWGDEISYPE